jgi:hypothetical protein
MKTGEGEALSVSGDGMPVPGRLVLDTERSVSSTSLRRIEKRLTGANEALMGWVRQYPVRAVLTGLLVGMVTVILVRR